jgi:hypothetical protein
VDGASCVFVRPSDTFHSHSSGELCQCREIVGISREHDSIGFRKRYEQGIDGGTSARLSPQECGTPSYVLGDFLDDIARLQQRVGVCIAGAVAFEAFNEDHGRNDGRPKVALTQLENQRCGLSGAGSESRDAPRIEKQHASSTGFARRPPFEPSRHGGGAFAILPRRRTDLFDQRCDVFVGLGEQVEAAHFRPNGLLKELGRGQPSGLHQVVEIVG